MFEAISWKEYGLVMAGAVGLYYGWWTAKYATSLGWKWLERKEQPVDGRLAALYAEPAKETKPAETTTEPAKETTNPTSVRVDPAVRVMEAPIVEGAGDAVVEAISAEAGMFLPLVAGELTSKVRGLVEKAFAAGVAEAEMLAGLRGLLTAAPYCRLKETAYREKTTNDIVQMLKSVGSPGIDANVVNGLWDG